MIAHGARSIRAHILGVIIVGAILPIALIGVWLTNAAVRSGKQLLHAQLDSSAAVFADAITRRWAFREGELLLLSTNVGAQHVLAGNASSSDSAYLAQLAGQLSAVIPSFSYRDVKGGVRWTSPLPRATDNAGGATARVVAGPNIPWDVPVRDSAGVVLGHVDVHVSLAALIGADSAHLTVPGAILSIRDPSTGAVLLPAAAAVGPRDSGETRVNRAQWLAALRTIGQPKLDVMVAAPEAAYVMPFERAGRNGLIALVVVVSIALGLSAFLTARLTAPVERLAHASVAVAGGDLDRRVELSGPAELQTLGTSFNAMTASLRLNMQELSRRSALAAVGEFAASMAHEVRNGLTSVKVDLQRAEERLEPNTVSRELVGRSLSAVTQLNGTVTGALRVARSGTVKRTRVDVRPLVCSAAERAISVFHANGASLDIAREDAAPAWVLGDGTALEQLFLNLLLNAGQALEPGGQATTTVNRENGYVVVAVTDTGPGIPIDQIDRIVEPFVTTRPLGTGLGLPIARQIAVVHGGRLLVESTVGKGTTVRVELPGCD